MVSVSSFGKVAKGDVQAVTISNGKRLSVTILTLGATINRILYTDRNGAARDLCLGYDSAPDYLRNDGYFGACIGRNGNRIAGSQFTLDGRVWKLTANEGRNQLHGGAEGFDKKIWDYNMESEAAVCFTYTAADGEEGFPGKFTAQVRYSVDDGDGLVIDYMGVSDRDTVANMTNHCYFNLNGQGSGDILGHVLQLNADQYTPGNLEILPTGEIKSVGKTAFDFRLPKAIGRDIGDAEIAPYKGYDTNLVLRGAGLRQVGKLTGDQSGVSMTISTTLEGLQLYTGNGISPRTGKDGAKYDQYGAVCLETQHFPNAINQTNFPSPVLRAGEKYHEITVYRFSSEQK